MTTAFTISIDWDRNNSFTDTYDDVTARVMQVNWFLGMRQPWQDKADNTMLALTVRNDDRRYASENVTSPLFGKVVPQRPVRIQSSDGTTTRTHWVGWVEAIKPAVGRFGERTVQLLASGVMPFYQNTETKLPLQQNKRTDEVIAELIKEVVIPPALSQAWVLGRVGNSEVGTSTYLADTSSYSVLEAGKLTLGMAADNWVIDGGGSDAKKTSFDVYRAIGDITASEGGMEIDTISWN